MMKHYVRQQVTHGNSYRTIDDYSAASIKEIILHIMQTDFSKNFNMIKYEITSDKSNLLDKTQFYKTGLTYKQIKTLSEDDVEDLCLMITTDKNRSSLNYVRICPYLHKNPITSTNVIASETKFNKTIKPIKLKIMPIKHLRFYTQINEVIMTSGFYIKPELAKVYNLKQVPFQTQHIVSQHISTVLVAAGLDMNHMDYNKIPKPIYDTMINHSSYFKDDRRSSYHKKFAPFFRDYFKCIKTQHQQLGPDVYISPYLACNLKLDITKPHKKTNIVTSVRGLSKTIKEQLNYTDKNMYIKGTFIDIDNIVNGHTYSSLFTD